jgi:protein-S-isoprenylcysteine O-methyltransferase Ste14
LKEKNGEHPFGDAGQLIILGVFLAIWILDSFFLDFSTSLRPKVPIIIPLTIFLVLFAISLYLLKSGHVVISYKQKPTEVVSSGAFRLVRHPLYLASLLTYLGLAILTCSPLAFLLIFGIFIFYDYIATYEEKLLIQKHGESYRVYRDKTGKWFPRL